MAWDAHGKPERADSRIRSQRSHAHGWSAITKGESSVNGDNHADRNADISLQPQFATPYVIVVLHSYVNDRSYIRSKQGKRISLKLLETTLTLLILL